MHNNHDMYIYIYIQYIYTYSIYIYIYTQHYIYTCNNFCGKLFLEMSPFFDTNCKLWPQARVLDLWHRMVSARYRDAVWVNHGMEIHNWLVVSNMAILCSISYIWDVIPNPLTFTSSFFKMVIAPPTRQSSPGDGEDPIGFVATLVVSGWTSEKLA